MLKPVKQLKLYRSHFMDDPQYAVAKRTTELVLLGGKLDAVAKSENTSRSVIRQRMTRLLRIAIYALVTQPVLYSALIEQFQVIDLEKMDPLNTLSELRGVQKEILYTLTLLENAIPETRLFLKTCQSH